MSKPAVWLGHATGDELPVAIADVLRVNLWANESACRIGGDEYVIRVPEGDQERIRRIADRLFEALGERFERFQIGRNALGVSIGAAIADAPGMAIDSVLARADRALYRAKREGNGRFCLD